MELNEELKVAVIGLGYVGLPLAVEFAKRRPVVGYDHDHQRILELNEGFDKTCEVSSAELNAAELIRFTDKLNDVCNCNCFIVAVPTPLDADNNPDLSILKEACAAVGSILTSGDLIIFESTVYPGVTEEVCVPILEQCSSLKLNDTLFVGYSPERVNPGDKAHRVSNIIKVTAASCPEAAETVDRLYQEIVVVGTHPVSNIKVAEAAKVIEN